MASTPSGTIFALADRILDGELAERLKQWRAERPRASYDDIARRLEAHGIEVSRETVRRWCDSLDLIAPNPEPEPERAA